jgi:hypothetical protein
VGKYDGLRDYLAGLPVDVPAETLSFEEVEKLVGELPPSARVHREWWANSSHSQAQAWREAGWHVDSVNQDIGRVVFLRGTKGGGYAARKAAEARAGATTEAKTAVADSVQPGAAASSRRGAFDGGLTEASVQAMLVAYLAWEGWEIRRVADTGTKDRGIDILAARAGRVLAVEVKGFPARGTYANPGRAAEIKPTHPVTQARHWYAQAVLKAMLTLNDSPDYHVAIGLPDVPTYRKLYEHTRTSLTRIGVQVMFVDEHGGVLAV